MILGKLQNRNNHVKDVEFEKLRKLIWVLFQLLSKFNFYFDYSLQSLFVKIFLEPLCQALEDLLIVIFVYN